MTEPLPPDYFTAMYDAAPDPWGFAERWYEQRKYALSLAALPEQHYRRALEPGCSVGVLTAALAQRCDHVLATDVTDAPLETARQRLDAAGVGERVELRRWALGEPWPAGTVRPGGGQRDRVLPRRDDVAVRPRRPARRAGAGGDGAERALAPPGGRLPR